MIDPQDHKIRNVIAHLENPEIRNPVSNPLEWHFEAGRRYIDGVYTGPPALAMLYHITGDVKYLHWMNITFWYPNLADPMDFGAKESSGTAFFIYALAWGVNNGILAREEFLPAVKKGWEGLVSVVSEEGKVQWGQLVSAGPYKILEEDSHEYVSGMFLLAASEMYKMEH